MSYVWYMACAILVLTGKPDLKNKEKDSMEEVTIKDWRGKIIGYIRTDRNGDKIVQDFSRKVLGRYDHQTDTTREFSGRVVAQGDVTAMFLKE